VKWPLIILVAYFGLSKLLDWLKKANLDQAIAQNNTISEVAKAGKRLIQAPQLTAPGSGVVGGAGGPVGGRGAIVTPHSEG
jgi:phosphoglycolate phosphatase-like HAD superfamily hydrolase